MCKVEIDDLGPDELSWWKIFEKHEVRVNRAGGELELDRDGMTSCVAIAGWNKTFSLNSTGREHFLEVLEKREFEQKYIEARDEAEDLALTKFAKDIFAPRLMAANDRHEAVFGYQLIGMYDTCFFLTKGDGRSRPYNREEVERAISFCDGRISGYAAMLEWEPWFRVFDKRMIEAGWKITYEESGLTVIDVGCDFLGGFHVPYDEAGLKALLDKLDSVELTKRTCVG